MPYHQLPVTPYEQPDPLAAQARVGAVQLQQQQLANEKVAGQSAQVQLQGQQLDLQSQQALMKAYQEAGGDLNRALPLAAKYGAKPQVLMDLRQKAFEQQKQNIELLNAKGARALQDADLMQGAYEQLKSAPAEQRPAMWPALMQQLGAAGVDTSNAPQQYPGDAALPMMGIGLKGHKAQLEELAKKAGIDKEQAQTQEAQIGAQQKSRVLAGTDAQGVTADQRAQLGVSRGRLSEEQRHNKVVEGLSAPGGDGGVSLDKVPLALQGQVKSILDYRQPMPPSGRNNPRNNAIQYWVNALDPNYEGTAFQARNKMMTAYTSGPESKSINAVNVALGHAGVLGDAIDALNNGNVKVLNGIANSLRMQVGQTPVATFRTIVHRLGPELAAAYIQGGGGEGERGTTAKDFDENLAPQVLKGNVGITARLLRSKISADENQWKQTMKRDDFQQRFITPEAQKTLDAYSPQSAAAGAGPAPGANGTERPVYHNGKLVGYTTDGKTMRPAQ